MILPRLPRIDFKRYRQRRYLVAVCEEFGRVALWKGMSYARSYCPLCAFRGGGSKRVAWWNFATGFFHCHKCGKTKDAVGIVCEALKVSPVEACRWLEQKAGAAESGFVA